MDMAPIQLLLALLLVVSSSGQGTSSLRFSAKSDRDCICQVAWTSPSDGGSCDQTQPGCTNDCSGGGHGGWCMVQNPGCAQEEHSGGGGWAYCDLDDDTNASCIGGPMTCGHSMGMSMMSTMGSMSMHHDYEEDCICQTAWTSPSDGGSCDQTQSGCTNDCSGGGHGGWCMVQNTGCAQEEHSGGGGWAYCDLDDDTDASCVGGPMTCGHSMGMSMMSTMGSMSMHTMHDDDDTDASCIGGPMTCGHSMGMSMGMSMTDSGCGGGSGLGGIVGGGMTCHGHTMSMGMSMSMSMSPASEGRLWRVVFSVRRLSQLTVVQLYQTQMQFASLFNVAASRVVVIQQPVSVRKSRNGYEVTVTVEGFTSQSEAMQAKDVVDTQEEVQAAFDQAGVDGEVALSQAPVVTEDSTSSDPVPRADGGDNNDSGNGSSNTGVITGAVLCLVGGATLLSGAAVLWRRQRRSDQRYSVDISSFEAVAAPYPSSSVVVPTTAKPVV